MGANVFQITMSGLNAKEAFNRAVSDARIKHGIMGYTGTIAEKRQFTLIPLPPGQDPLRYADQLIDFDDDRVSDTWGPAGCIDLGPDPKVKGHKLFLFFGWASS